MTLALQEHPSVAIMDLGLPPDPDGVSEGFATLDGLTRQTPDMKIIVATSHGDRTHALRAIAAGAYDFCEKPIDIQVLGTIVQRSLRLHTLEDENRRLSEAPAPSPIKKIVTADEGMLKVCRDIEKLAGANVSVLLLGRERHRQGSLGARAARPRAARASAVRRHQLRRDPGEPAGERVVRPRTRRFHRRRQADPGPDRTRQPRHAVPRRDRRSAAPAPGEAAALPAGPGGGTDRRTDADPGRRPCRVGDQPEPAGSCGRGPIPRRSILSFEPDHPAHPAAARAGRATGSCSRAISSPSSTANTAAPSADSPRMRWPRSPSTHGPATSASWKTGSSARS